MSQTAMEMGDFRDQIIADPDMVLEDPEVMKALIAANEKHLGNNIVDLRGIAMERLEARLDRLEDTHRSVIAAAYENLAGTNQVHRAILTMLDPVEFEAFIANLAGNVAETLCVEKVRLVLESAHLDSDETRPVERSLGDVVALVPPGWTAEYASSGRTPSTRQVTLRQVSAASAELYGDKAGWVGSEALLRLDFGEGRLPGMLVMGAEDPHQFRSNQGTDLLTFFGGVFERVMRRWLA
ncbi:DUF484 domain-containing protein [Maritimibacter sp. 55A14]|uniref:DUF484 family protein n=1 Tax=Maritimibacter sp. 55A14 TaxID=2174844 RepID=UPI000D605D52|nr:DUF484 family protein [Maritimibacter sp. 55A14]PWE32157.1 DUF484 domain-containing protein [Maritimibacter sp. 55A14]